MEKKGVVVKVSGSFLDSILEGDNAELGKLKEFSRAIADLHKSYNVGIVIGGGKIARRVINIGRALGRSEAQCDILADKAQRLNSSVLYSAFDRDVIYDGIIDNLTVASDVITKKGLIGFLSGNFPGQSMDNVAAQYCAYTGIRTMVKIINNVDGVYDADPKKYKNAKLINSMSYDKLLDLTKKDSRKAGSSNVFDYMASKAVSNNRIELYIIGYKDINNIKDLIEGRYGAGTVVNSYGTRNKDKDS